ncbi:hypothetical protein TNCV_563231 [Trichonephila clavipes]|nr:hypothetical protein TNCV_563231 [Trichonephila clavipes]
MRLLKSRIFSGLCKDMGAVHRCYFIARQDGYHVGNFCSVFMNSEMKERKTYFLEEENLQEAEKYRDDLFVMKLSYILGRYIL